MSKIKKNIDFMIGNVDGKTYLANGMHVFELNDTSAMIFSLINGKKSIKDIINQLAKMYNKKPEDISQDVVNTVEYFLKIEAIIKTKN